VLDTNIYISAILFGGKPEMLIHLAREKVIEVFISELLLDELARIFKIKFNWTNEQIYFTIDGLRKITHLVIPTETLDVIELHRSDNRILECALEAKADYIISGDRHHILPLKIFQGIKILSVSEFLENDL
jgi:uncharacterized protein